MARWSLFRLCDQRAGRMRAARCARWWSTTYFPSRIAALPQYPAMVVLFLETPGGFLGG